MPPAHPLHRFITFLDAIVAIALTLLILPLADAASEVDPSVPIGDFLRENDTRIGAFLLSFVVIARLWRAHHSLFERVAGYDQVILTASLIWALSIVVLPFPTELVAVYSDDTGVRAIYIGVLVISTATLAITSLHVSRTPALQAPRGTGDGPPSAAAAVAIAGWCAVAWVLAVVVPPVNYFALLLLLLAGPSARWWTRR